MLKVALGSDWVDDAGDSRLVQVGEHGVSEDVSERCFLLFPIPDLSGDGTIF
jgi:hypothetical protein